LALFAADAVVLPPLVAAVRRRWPVFGTLWAPPLACVAILLLANPVSKAAEPQGAARQAYVTRALAAAEVALRSGDWFGASRRMTPLSGDAATNPAIKAMLARIDAAQSAEQVR